MIWEEIQPSWIPVLIFLARSTDVSFGTLRLLTVTRGRKSLAWVLAIFQATLFVTAIAGLLTNLVSLSHILAYAGGYATGNVLGMTIESIFAPGHSLLRIISTGRHEAVMENLLGRGWGATELFGQGQNGTVGSIMCIAPRRRIKQAIHAVIEIDPEAFITVQHVREVRGGWRA
jgi:uncharacterized protein YebE (UPF0316 family)